MLNLDKLKFDEKGLIPAIKAPTPRTCSGRVWTKF